MIILYTSLVFSCVWLGVIMAKKLHTRENIYSDMAGFLNCYYTNLSFAQKGFREIVNLFIESGVSVEFARFLTSKLDGDENRIEFLNARENKELEDIILSLGKQDEETEKRMVEEAITLIKSRLEQASKKAQKYSGFSIKISLLVGVLLVILLL